MTEKEAKQLGDKIGNVLATILSIGLAIWCVSYDFTVLVEKPVPLFVSFITGLTLYLFRNWYTLTFLLLFTLGTFIYNYVR